MWGLRGVEGEGGVYVVSCVIFFFCFAVNASTKNIAQLWNIFLVVTASTKNFNSKYCTTRYSLLPQKEQNYMACNFVVFTFSPKKGTVTRHMIFLGYLP